MTLGMRVRLWYRQASGPERSSGLALMAVVAAVLVLALLTTSTTSPASLSAGLGSAAPAGTAPGTGAGGAGAVTAQAGAVPGNGGSPAGSGTTASGSTGAAAPGAIGASVPGATGAAAASVSSPRSGGANGSTGSGTGSACGNLSASDQGVTPTTIKIGFLIVDTGGIQNSGFVLGLRTDMPQVIKAYVDGVNRAGGVDCRKLIYVTSNVDPTSTGSSQESACVNMTEDQKVFAVIDSASTDGSYMLCYPQHHVPLFAEGISTISAAWMSQSFPYLVSTYSDGSRQVIDWADYFGNRGLFKGQKVGVLSSDCAPSPQIVSGDLEPALAKFGVHPVVVSLSCDTSTAQQEIPNAVLQMRQAGVTLVFPGTSFTNVQLFLEDAQSIDWHPKYSASDYEGMSLDLFDAHYPASEWNGTQAVTATPEGETAVGRPFPAAAAPCNKWLVAENVPPMTNYDADAEAAAHCDGIRLFVAAANKAGPDLTRIGWGEAVQKLGAFPAVYSAKAVYGPHNMEGGDSLALEQWYGSCSCWKQLQPHNQPAYA